MFNEPSYYTATVVEQVVALASEECPADPHTWVMYEAGKSYIAHLDAFNLGYVGV